MIRKIFILGAFAVMISCNSKAEKETTTTENGFKTAFIDSDRLVKEYTETVEIESKYKVKSEQMTTALQSDIEKFQKEVQNFQANAQTKGMDWAQKKQTELQKRERELGERQQKIMQEIQVGGGNEMDSALTKVKDFIGEYGEKNGYDYIFNTQDKSTVLYSKKAYDITDDIIESLNKKYKSAPKENTSISEKAADSTATK